MSKNSELFEQAKAYYVGGVHAANRLHSCILTTWMDAICTTRMARNIWISIHPPVRPSLAIAIPG